jgi:hypothetical protein
MRFASSTGPVAGLGQPASRHVQGNGHNAATITTSSELPVGPRGGVSLFRDRPTTRARGGRLPRLHTWRPLDAIKGADAGV